MKFRPILIVAVLALSACSDSNTKSATTTFSSTTTSTTSVETTTPSTSSTEPASTSAPAPSTTTLAPPTTARPTTTSPTADPATTEVPTSIPATTNAAVTDWKGVLQTLGQRRQDLYTAPDVSKIPTICGDQTSCADQLNVQIGDLANKGLRVTGADPYTVLDANVEKFDGDSLDTSLLVTIVAVIQRPKNAGKIIDATGAVVADVQPGTTPGHNAHGRSVLARVGPPDDPWRLVSQDSLPEVPA